MTSLNGDPPWRRVALLLLAIAAAAVAWLVAVIIGPVVGTEAIWPFDRIGLVLAALGGVEALLNSRRAGGH